MKTSFSRLRRGSLFFFLALGSLLLYNCDSKDLDFIDPYEFVNDDFDNLPDLPPVEDEDPEITEPETGSVENSEATRSIITDIMNAGSTGEISGETRTNLAKVEEFTAQLPASAKETAQNLTSAEVRNILDLNQELPANLVELRESLNNVPAEVKALLPKINYTSDLEGVKTATNVMQQKAPARGKEKKDAQKQAVTGSCAEAAYDAYDAAFLDLTEQRDANLFIIESNYARRLDEADTRYAERLEEHTASYEAYLVETSGLLDDILSAADEAESIGETELAEQLRMLTLVYAVDARTALEEWNTLVLELLEITMEQEKAWALERRETLTAQLETDFAAAQSEADALLQQSLDDCHNQGSGN